MTMAPQNTRTGLRRQLRATRRALSPMQQKKAAVQLYRQLVQHPIFRRARHVAFYIASDGEIDPRLLLQKALRKKIAVYLPVLARWPKRVMHFQRLRPSELLVRNRYKIPQPKPCSARQCAPWILDLILLPLVGFTPDGTRLGMGGGFYDRALAQSHRRTTLKPCRIGLAHDCQKVVELPQSALDIPLTACVTDQAWYVAPRHPANPRTRALHA